MARGKDNVREVEKVAEKQRGDEIATLHISYESPVVENNIIECRFFFLKKKDV